MSELLEKILSKDNMNAAYKRVCANKGAGGVDDVTVEGELGEYPGANQEQGIQTPASQEGRESQAGWRGEETRNTDRNGQGNSARHSASDKSHV